MLERELLLLQVVLKTKNITRVIHGDFDLLTPKELGTQTFKNGGFTDNHDVSKKIGAYFGAYFGTYQFFAEVQAQKLCLN